MTTRTWSVRTQLLTLVLVSCGVLLLALGGAVWQMELGGKRFSSFLDRELGTEREVMRAYANGLQMGQAVRNILLDPGNQRAYENFDNAKKQLETALQVMHRQGDLLDGGPAAATALEQAVARWIPLQERVIEQVRRGDSISASNLLVNSETPAWREVRTQLVTQVSHLEQLSGSVRTSSATALQRSRALVGALGLVAVLICVVAVVLITRSLLRRLGGEPAYAAAVAQRIADGDLQEPVAHAQTGSTSLLAAMSSMQTGLSGIIHNIRSDAARLVEAAHVLRSNEEQVAEASLAQSDAAQAIAAAVEQLSTSIAVIAEHAADAGQLSTSAEQLLADSVAVVREAVRSIEQISERMSASAAAVTELGDSVANISGIAQVIDGVAEQTNLLALNAAIEAARAGEHGRGFAVVADEVRKLAERTRQSTHEINAIIERVQNHTNVVTATMDEGLKLAEAAGTSGAHASSAIAAIEQNAAGVCQLVASIDLALGEQRQASLEIARGVEQIARMSTDNHDATNNSLQHANELSTLADALAQAVSRFRLRA